MIVAGTGFAYSLLFIVNDWLLEFLSLKYTAATHWIYLPSGFRLVFVLLFGFLGALGVAIGSAVVAHFYYFQTLPVLAVGAPEFDTKSRLSRFLPPRPQQNQALTARLLIFL